MNDNATAKKLISTNYGTHDKKLKLDVLKEAMPDLDTDSIVLLPEVSVHVNPEQIWEPINLRLRRSTQ